MYIKLSNIENLFYGIFSVNKIKYKDCNVVNGYIS